MKNQININVVAPRCETERVVRESAQHTSDQRERRVAHRRLQGLRA